MNTKKIFSRLLVIFGEVLIILCFLYFGRNAQTEILVLNIVVSTLIYCLLFFDIIVPWVDFKDKSQKKIGSIGLRWFFTFFYVIIAIGAMIVFNSIKPIHFQSQILIQGVLFFLLLLGLFMAFASSEKVREVFIEEKENRNRLDEMKKATKEVQQKLEQMKDFPLDILPRIINLMENIRYISPCNSPEAIELETNYIIEIKSVSNCLFEIPLNYDRLTENITTCERIYNERKKVFSN